MKVILNILGWISIVVVIVIGINVGEYTAERYSDFNFWYAFATWTIGLTGSMLPFVAAKHLKNQEEMLKLLGKTDLNQEEE